MQSTATTMSTTTDGRYTGHPAFAGTHSRELKDFVGTKFYRLHAVADSN